MPDPVETIGVAPTGLRRHAINGFIGLFLLLQATIPLRYYFGDTGLDERFSWRFFSSVSLRKHAFRLQEELDPAKQGEASHVPLNALLQLGSIKKLLATHHTDIVHRFLLWRISDPAVTELRYERTTTRSDGTQLPTVHLSVDAGSGTIRSFEPNP